VNSNFLIKTAFGDETVPVTRLDSAQLAGLREALNYQLSERMSFIKQKDPIVALLLFELGNVTAIAEDVTSALRIYDLAIKYGYDSEVLKKRYQHFVDLQSGLDNEYTNPPRKGNLPAGIKQSPPKRNNNLVLIASGVLLACFAAIVILSRNKKQAGKQIN
jgi:hypothetical protein